MNAATENEVSSGTEFTGELQPGTTLLHGQYTIESFLNSGGFGMTYLARDSLDRTVVIKECFPASFCCRSDLAVRARSRAHQSEFKSIVRLFVLEARRLSKLKHPNIVGVHQVFEDNETAYMALDFVDGQDLLEIVELKQRKLGPEDIRKVLLKILAAIGFMHERNILHRDISPDNILLDVLDNPVLIDFGAAREEVSKVSRALSALLVIKDGYSPQEFYIAGGEQGPPSDLYALGATFHHLITGQAPPNSQARLAAIAADQPDPYKSLINRAPGYERSFLAAIDRALEVFPKDRMQTAAEWLVEVDVEKRREAALAKAAEDKDTEQSISKLVSETNQAVMAELQSDGTAADNLSGATDDAHDAVASDGALQKNSQSHQSYLDSHVDEATDAPKRWSFRRSVSKRSVLRFLSLGKSPADHLRKAGL